MSLTHNFGKIEMGGRGSGTWIRWGKRTVCEDLTALSIKRLRADGALGLGKRSTLSWSRGGEALASITVEHLPGGLLLNYRTMNHRTGTWQPVRDLIPWDHTQQHYGGTRLWFVCPHCQKRCGVLYGGSLYRCRKCYDLGYASQYDPYRTPEADRARAIRRKLGGSTGLGDPFPPRPKWMHHRTYDRLRDACFHLEGMADENLASLMDQILAA